MSSLAVSVPKDAIVLPSNVRFQVSGKDLILQKVKRRTRRFKMSKKQRDKISAASRKFKWPLLTTAMVAPAVLISASNAMTVGPLVDKFFIFARDMLSFYSGVIIEKNGTIVFSPQRALIGWAPIAAVAGVKLVAKGRVMAINRALSRMQIPATLG